MGCWIAYTRPEDIAGFESSGCVAEWASRRHRQVAPQAALGRTWLRRPELLEEQKLSVRETRYFWMNLLGSQSCEHESDH